eukprot:TRINITY_DN64053_c0_g1_i1.p1 TRINITY_DN64053_c0_g1~~TRINITY_DN64053_c0_g1_i1.p1  ORF type:complete len:187 (-),score=30.22 TRINITY_DN64053_c0_g1_i1:43-528(-)
MQQSQADKKPIRTMTAYIRSPAQLNKVRAEESSQSKSSKSAKNFFRNNESQMVADLFRSRVEQELEDEIDDWKVDDYMGDLVRKAILKVQVSEDEYVHIFARRRGKTDPWLCRYAAYKSKQDPLDQNEEDYPHELPERRMCSERFDGVAGACSGGDSCTIM